MLSGELIGDYVKYGTIKIDPFDVKCLNPNSYDVHIGNKILCYTREILEPKIENPTCEWEKEKLEDCWILYPGYVYLANTVEYTETPNHIPCLEGKSSLARLGLSIHATAGFGDVGFCGKWTLELFVQQPLKIYPGMRIGQLYYEEIQGGFIPYQGKYQKSESVIPSRSWKDEIL